MFSSTCSSGVFQYEVSFLDGPYIEPHWASTHKRHPSPCRTHTFWLMSCQSDLRYVSILHRCVDLHCHCSAKPLPSAMPHKIQEQATPALPSCLWFSPDLADKSILHPYNPSPHIPHPNVIACLWMDGGTGLTAGQPSSSLPLPSAWWAHGMQEECFTSACQPASKPHWGPLCPKTLRRAAEP